MGEGSVIQNYKTKHSEEILSFLKSIPGTHITAAEVCERLRKNGSTVGLATVYRQLEKLVADGVVQKYNLEGSSACFEFVGEMGGLCNESCFHCKCLCCGRLIHLSCSEIQHLKEHILCEHQFDVDTTRTVFYGICSSCKSA